MKILFLYTELAGYTVNCLRKAMETTDDLQIVVVRWPVNKEAPFQFDFGSITVVEKSDYSGSGLMNFVEEMKPDAIFCSGWIDKDYTKICKNYRNKIPVVLALDNHWIGNLKQKLAAVLSPLLIKNTFNKVWVPGEKQAMFARKLGFKEKDIEKGFYTADVNLFKAFGENCVKLKSTAFPKKILYVGRYVEHKGIFDLWKAFIEVVTQEKNDSWELICVGTGDQWEKRVEHPQIKHLGFIQPENFQEIINQTSFYILPSHFEPWGVSLHEFAAAGFPVIVSDQIGSSEAFCENGRNGFLFESGNIAQLKDRFSSIMKISQEDFLEMQKHSINLALKNTPTLWGEKLLKLANG